jgi:hypothetical protein
MIFVNSLLRPSDTLCEEARDHLGLEMTQQWHDWCVSRSTPAVSGLYAIITLAASQLIGDQVAPVRTTA